MMKSKYLKFFLIIVVFAIANLGNISIFPKNAYAVEVSCYISPWLTDYMGRNMYSCPSSIQTCYGGPTACGGTFCDESSGGVGNTVCMPQTTWGYNCHTQCGTGGSGGVGPPNDDVVWARVFSRNVGGSSYTYWGPAHESSGLTTNSSYNRRDYNVQFAASGGEIDGRIWSGHMCGRGLAFGINADGTLQRNNSTNSACEVDGDGYCEADVLDGCGANNWFSGANPRVRSSMGENANTMAPINKLYSILGTYTGAPAVMPRQRYNQVYTFNFKAPEGDEYKVKLTSPDSYFCYAAFGMRRHDDGTVNFGHADLTNQNGYGGGLVADDSGKRLRIRTDLENPEFGVLDDGTRCEAEVDLEGGGNYVLFEVRKSVIGRVVSLDGSANAPTGIPGIQVRLRYNIDNSVSTTVSTTTDSKGYYRFNIPNLYTSQYYTVYVNSPAPAGHVGSAFTVNTSNYAAPIGSNISYTYRSDGRDTKVGDYEYGGQSTTTDNDCSSSNVGVGLGSARCVFAFNRSGNQNPIGTLNVVNNSNKVPAGLPYDHAVCLNRTVTYSATMSASPHNSSVLHPTAPFSLMTGATGQSATNNTWNNQFNTNVIAPPGKSMSVTNQNNLYSSGRGYVAGSNYYVRLTVVDNANRTCSGNPYVNFATHPSVRYCGAYSPNITNPMTDTNASKPYKTVHIPHAPRAPTVSASTNERGQITVRWSYPSSTTSGYLQDVQRYRIYRNGTHIADVPGSTNQADFRYVDKPTCNDTNVTYIVRAETGYRDVNGTIQSCGTLDGQGVGRCEGDLKPTCNIQYRNSSGTWVGYNNNLRWPKNTNIPVRLVCTDPNNDPIIRYNWTTSCGTISPTNTQVSTFRTSNINNQSCNLTGIGYDRYPDSSGSSTVIIRTETATPGTQVLSTAGLGNACLSKSSPTTTAVSFIVTNYDDSGNGLATLNSTLSNSICGMNGTSRIGNCAFTANNALSIAYPPLRTGTRTQPIRVTMRTGTTPNSYGINKGGFYSIRVSWDPYTGATRNISNSVCVADLAPTITSPLVTKINNTQYRITANTADDWSLRGLRIDILNDVGSVVATPIGNSAYFTERTVAQMTNANHTGVIDRIWDLNLPNNSPYDGVGNHRARIWVWDNYGHRSEVITPVFFVDRTAPVCTGITFDPTPHDGTRTNVIIQGTATDNDLTKRPGAVFTVSSPGVTSPIYTSPKVFANTSNVAQTTWNFPNTQARGIPYNVVATWSDDSGNVSSCNSTYTLNNPKISIAGGSVQAVDDSSLCPINSAPTVGLSGATVTLSGTANETATSAANGTYSFPPVLEFGNKSYTIEVTGLPTGYAKCPELNSYSYSSTTPVSYNGSNAQITGPTFKVYRQEASKWWQAYNGGVHSNDSIVFPINGESGLEGMPEGAVIIGDPTGTNTNPQGFDMYAALGIDETIIPKFYSGALYSAFGTDPSTNDFFGISSETRNWGAPDLVANTNSPLKFDNSIETLFENIKVLTTDSSSGWSEHSNYNSAVSDGKAYFKLGANKDIGGNVSSTSEYPVVFIELDNGDTLNIVDNITTVDHKPLILYVKGDVDIDSSVTRLDSVFLVSSGTIRFTTAGDDSDVPIDINGGIYGQEVIFERDLIDSLATSNDPAERIFYNSSLVGKSDLLPSEITESKVYYILTE